jgi:glc operon protein GlcG
MTRFIPFAAVLPLILAAQPQLATRKALTLEVVKVMASAAEAEAKRHNLRVAFAIVDEGGHLLYFQRMDGVNAGAVQVAQRKAESAALYKRPGKAFADRVAGEPQVMVLPGAFPFEGGLPILHEGEVIGAIGVSGATSAQDAEIANAALGALSKLVKK